ncbi:MAG: FKBP-type peptidyl-prolyl cis-trans isomerase [Verrucomicrobiota bacterium]|jgi:FKBP-type peptidyl-prolyl cis-trans isomerase
MKKNMLVKLVLCGLALQAGSAAQKALADDGSLKTDKAKTSYAMGAYYGNAVKSIGMEVDLDALTKGLKDVLAGNTTALTPAEMNTILQALSAKVQADQEAKRKEQEATYKEEMLKDNLKEGTDFLAKNKSAPGVITLTNGLQYKIITAGKGAIPKPTDHVRVSYRGTFLDGKQFDATRPGDSFPCSLEGGVIDGWIEILKIMPVGSKWKVFIPPGLAYHAEGHPGAIPPNATLVFEMELVSIDPPK